MREPTENQRAKMPSKAFVAALYIPLLLPAAVPLYLAREQDDPLVVAILVGTTLALLIGNALLLVILYRWFSSLSKP